MTMRSRFCNNDAFGLIAVIWICMLKVEIATRKMNEFQALMLEDIRCARDFGLQNPTHFALRTILRTSAAYIEGTVYQLRLVCLAASEDNPSIFSPDEFMALKEQVVTLSDTGTTKRRDSFQKIQPSILFTFSMFAKIHDMDFEPNRVDHRWGSLRRFFTIRNSLMHPKNIDDFEITDEKNKLAREAVGWFRENLAELFRFCEERDQKPGNSATK